VRRKYIWSPISKQKFPCQLMGEMIIPGVAHRPIVARLTSKHFTTHYILGESSEWGGNESKIRLSEKKILAKIYSSLDMIDARRASTKYHVGSVSVPLLFPPPPPPPPFSPSALFDLEPWLRAPPLLRGKWAGLFLPLDWGYIPRGTPN